MPRDVRTLYIFMNEFLVGRLEKQSKGILQFFYEPSWLAMAGARPLSLSLPLSAKRYMGDVVYHFFDNLLPDNPQIRARIQAKFSAKTDQPFDLLEKIGRDCVGAIQLNDVTNITIVKSIQLKKLNEKNIAEILRHYQNYPLGMMEDTDFRISIAGAQEKAALLYYKKKWSLPLEQTPTTHILKLPIGRVHGMDLTDSCENEWLCAQIAAAFGLPVAKCDILYFEEVKVLAVERFDRKLSSDKTWIMRLPQEDMCQALGFSPNLKYQADGGPGISEVMNLLLGAIDPLKDRDAFFRSQVLFWLLAAIDGHAKNFSIFIEPEGKYQLTPLYDVMSAYPLIESKQLQPQKIKMAMALKGKNNHYYWHNIQHRHFIEAAKNANYSPSRAQAILDEMLERVDSVIDKVSTMLPSSFPKQISTSIFEGMIKMKKKLIKR
ncbi:HipA domain-containing protein [Candidatus Berkiella aquae]|uniref:Serine/threonine-protein kinase HipA n=1 Tax=Candidatus Berkiella aquae TaxID=295108 RepID=A0A0Q9YU06_9GAMM|nr:type II toxin-antitoxin system HipA family toxin [Candidatus Berkiella aquae]MCS5712297.1 type II toxin-antitoxin system HipA family toxin [Candidatus Berkiella aquae]